MPSPVVAKPQLPTWADPANASVFDMPGQGLLRKVVGLLGLDDPNQVMAFGTPLETGAATGGLVDKLAETFPRFARAIKAYHGSPHDFETFDVSKIGTGEGAQAYGHGLYFAESPEVAGQYRNMAPREFLDGPVNWDNPVHVAIRASDLAGGRERGIERLSQTLSATTADAKNKQIAAKAIDFLKSGESFDKYAKGGGHAYEVAIKADPDHFLDWDKPLSQQTPNVRAAADKLYGDVRPVKVRDGWYSVTRIGPDGSGHSMASSILESSPEDAMRKFAEWRDSDNGANFYRMLEQTKPGAARASEALKEVGIPGIKYLDQGSRAAGEGSRNYVVFDDKTIEILRKYGLLPPITGAALAGSRKEPQQ